MESLSEMPICRMLAVMVMIAAVCPGGRVSRVEIGCLNRAFRYASRIAADIRILAIRKPSYRSVSAHADVTEIMQHTIAI